VVVALYFFVLGFFLAFVVGFGLVFFFYSGHPLLRNSSSPRSSDEQLCRVGLSLVSPPTHTHTTFLRFPRVPSHLRIRILRYDLLSATSLFVAFSQQLLIVRALAVHFLYRYHPWHELLYELSQYHAPCPIHLRPTSPLC
jgi:hypothetical protein